MHTHVDKLKKDAKNPVTEAVAQRKKPGAPSLQFEDNRPEAKAQRSLQQDVIQAYTIENPTSVQTGTAFKSESIAKDGPYSRAYEESTKTVSLSY